MVERDVKPLAAADFCVTFLRNATAYGASPRMRFDIVINDLCALAWTTKRIAMTSDGSPWRPIVHLEDICTAIRCVLDAPVAAVNGQVFNVGQNSENYRVREIAQIVADVFPGCELSTGTGGADNRSYRVSFDKISTQAAGVQLQMDRAPGRRRAAVALRADRVRQRHLRVPRLYAPRSRSATCRARTDRRATFSGADMRFESLSIDGAVLVRIERSARTRGVFLREHSALQNLPHTGWPRAAVQASVSYNERAGTVRGMHFQWPPSREAKLVRCLRGSCTMCCWIFGRGSPSYLRHVAVTLDEDNRDAVFIPHGVAHGFQTLWAVTRGAISDDRCLRTATGCRSALERSGIFNSAGRWPMSIVISERDANYPDFDRRAV